MLVAQPSWAKKLPKRGVPVKMIQTQDGGYALLAQTDYVNFQFNKITIIKCDVSGDTVWTKIIDIGDSTISYPYDFIETTNNNFVMVGSMGKGTYLPRIIIKTNPYGDTLWVRQFISTTTNGNGFLKTSEINNDTVLVLGGEYPYLFIHKFDEAGNLLNVFTQDTFRASPYHHLRKDLLGNPVILKSNIIWNQSINQFVHTQNIFKTDNDLNHSIDKAYKGMEGKFSCGSLDGGFAFYDGYGYGLIKVDNNLDSLWSKPFSEYSMGFNENYQFGRDIAPTSDTGFILCGVVDVPSVFKFPYLIKTDSLGNKEWSKDFMGYPVDNIVSVVQSADGGYVMLMSGDADSTNVPYMWLVKSDAQGNVVSIPEFSTVKNEVLIVIIYPNPANDFIYLNFKNPFEGEINIYDVVGRLVYSEEIQNQNLKQINIHSLNKGIYIVVARNIKRGTSKNLKLIKQ
jgi:hypothetical protein